MFINQITNKAHLYDIQFGIIVARLMFQICLAARCHYLSTFLQNSLFPHLSVLQPYSLHDTIQLYLDNRSISIYNLLSLVFVHKMCKVLSDVSILIQLNHVITNIGSFPIGEVATTSI